MTFERLADRLAGGGVPDARRLVVRGGDDALAVGAERPVMHTTFMAKQLADQLAGGGVPDARRLRGGDDALAIRAEHRAIHVTFMASERLADRLADRGVPDARRPVFRSGDDAP